MRAGAHHAGALAGCETESELKWGSRFFFRLLGGSTIGFLR